MSEKLYAKVGVLSEKVEDQDRQYTQLFILLRDVVTGKTDPRRVFLNLTDRTWVLSPVGESHPMPATINGVPECVVGCDNPRIALLASVIDLNNAEIAKLRAELEEMKVFAGDPAVRVPMGELCVSECNGDRMPFACDGPVKMGL